MKLIATVTQVPRGCVLVVFSHEGEMLNLEVETGRRKEDTCLFSQTPDVTPGGSVGLFFKGTGFTLIDSAPPHRYPHRPYLHMYTSSNELEEVGIISLAGMNIECDANKEDLLGVSPEGPLGILSHHFCRNRFVSRCSQLRIRTYLQRLH